MVASTSYSLFVILLVTTVITILPSFNMLPIVQSQDDGDDDGGNDGDDDGGNDGDDDGGNDGDDDGGNDGDDGEGNTDITSFFGNSGEGGTDDTDDDGGDDGDDGEGNTDITSFFGNSGDGIPQDTASHPGALSLRDAVSGRSSTDALSDQSPTRSDIQAFAPPTLAGGNPPPSTPSAPPSTPSAPPSTTPPDLPAYAPSLALQQPDSEKDKTTMGSSQSGSTGFASATEEDKVIQENIPIQSQQPQFTHITKLIAEDLKKMPLEEIRTYPWNELGNEDVELVIKYLSYDPKFLGKILVNTPEDGIIKFQNSISLKTFNEIIANMPPEQVQLIKDKFS